MSIGVAQQRIDGHLRCADAVFELVDQVLLIAAVIGQEDNVGRRGLMIVREIEEVPNLVEEPLISEWRAMRICLLRPPSEVA